MAASFKTINQTYTAGITEKKSRFIATLTPVSDEAEAAAFVKECKKKYWDARHNCSAYIIGTSGQQMHSSDDGEPSGTAGKPILSVLSGNGLYNVCAVVTRYFGGILLGTGGLVRAYSGAVEECIKAADLKEMIQGCHIKIEASYTDAGKLQYMFSNDKITVISSEYTDKVIFNVIVPEVSESAFIKKLSETTSNKAAFEILDRNFYEI